jgi:hypothetical protein
MGQLVADFSFEAFGDYIRGAGSLGGGDEGGRCDSALGAVSRVSNANFV